MPASHYIPTASGLVLLQGALPQSRYLGLRSHDKILQSLQAVLEDTWLQSESILQRYKFSCQAFPPPSILSITSSLSKYISKRINSRDITQHLLEDTAMPAGLQVQIQTLVQGSCLC